MAENPYFSYTKRDYESSRKEGLAKIPMMSEGKWTDLNATDPGVIILDYVHAIVDMVNYYQDHQALEVFLSTAKERENIFRIAKQLSYKIRSAKGALLDVIFSTMITYDHPIQIPKYTAVIAKNGTRYLTREDAYLPAGETEVVIPCIQGELVTRQYIGTGASRYSEEGYDQTYQLTQHNIDIDSISITDDLNRVWKQKDYIVFSDPDEKAYELDLLYDDTVEVKFGCGDRGYVPQPTDTLNIKYIVTKGAEGAINEGEITSLLENVYDGGALIPFRVTNRKGSTGGSDTQSSAAIKELAPGVIKAQERAVTLLDFENLAENIPGVREARAYDINIIPEILHHEVRVLIIPEDSYIEDLDRLKTEVYQYLYERMIPPTVLTILIPEYIPIDIEITAKVYQDQEMESIRYLIYKRVNEYFNNRTDAIGIDFYPAELSAQVSALESVRYVMDISPNSVVDINEYAIAILGNLTINLE